MVSVCFPRKDRSICIHPFIHPSVFCCLSGSGSWASVQTRDVPLPPHAALLSFPSHLRNFISATSLGPAPCSSCSCSPFQLTVPSQTMHPAAADNYNKKSSGGLPRLQWLRRCRGSGGLPRVQWWRRCSSVGWPWVRQQR